MTTLDRDHLACAAVLRSAGSSFALPIRLLPGVKRRGTTALYAFCRLADDIVDEAVDSEEARRGLDRFAAAVAAALEGGWSDEPILRALADTVRRFAVPRQAIDDILDGVRMDLVRHSYDTAAELDDYCRKVASAVGVAAVHVWGFLAPAAIECSDDCGIAFQYTNILRDIPEDLHRGRIYLPAEDLVACGCTAEELRAGVFHDGFDGLAQRLIARAEERFARAAALDRLLTTDGRVAFRAMFGVYRSLLRAVRAAGRGIFSRRVKPARPLLLAAAARGLLLGPGRSRRTRGR
ncbi:MAG: phytoene/squalene synthase family protein [Planctomycetes bacterium]|nr:phytoene/squalene synthase family protein [Planctomycetota bacterium]